MSRVGGFHGSAAHQRADTGQQLGKGEGFYQIVVGPGIEPADAIFYSISGCEQKHRHGGAALAERRQNFQSTAARQHHIENQKIEAFRACQIEAVLAGIGHRDGVVIRLQTLPQGVRQLLFVLNY